MSKYSTLHRGEIVAADINFVEHALKFAGASISEAGFTSARTATGEFIFHEHLLCRPLPVERFCLYGVDPIIRGEFRRHENLPTLGCAHIVATRDGNRVFFASSANEPLREVSLGEAIDLLIERRQELGGAL
ncbi:TPA: hypothetical protein R2K55_004212 [Raoultella ornithinolytica]|uniref:hypothetical protein n=1 Tax=Raoultella ornithinolytica TaxID=54291 RepID=UPI00273DE834|nr:hypothetical protein [Raoultella ornithinolytica]WLP46293.1 hypothetical protein Q7A27_00315 [Raoultella ornithinolytica]HEC2552468.1 hypothetical protein [Raoultella ornithinolytica]HEC2605237.1 hypothetical protein [Raoultella ornithinolytica]HEC2611334.1 hypothetical protein [Raoultella ornithinolytica]